MERLCRGVPWGDSDAALCLPFATPDRPLNLLPWTALCSVHSRLSVSWSWWALPALAVLPVLRGGTLCDVLMRTPGAELALGRLYHVLDMLQ